MAVCVLARAFVLEWESFAMQCMMTMIGPTVYRHSQFEAARTLVHSCKSYLLAMEIISCYCCYY